jgi:hypothetical protein
MRAAQGILSVAILIGATGCAAVPQRYQLAAAPLMDVPPAYVVQPVPSGMPPGTPATTLPLLPIAQVNLLVQDSQRKCAEFVNSLFAETAGSGLILDVLSTGTSAIASFVTPLSTAHSLAAASTVLGATKTGITANYLNTLSISHIAQAIQSTYTTDMTNYINSLAALDPNNNKIDVFQERSKILSYHNECALAAAEGSISSALKTPASVGQGLTVSHTVTDAEINRPGALAQGLAIDINRVFANAGVTAQTEIARPSVINLRMTSPFKLTVTSSPAGLVQYVEKPSPVLTIIGTPHKGDTITISGPSAAQQSSNAGETAPAAPAGQAPDTKANPK